MELTPSGDHDLSHPPDPTFPANNEVKVSQLFNWKEVTQPFLDSSKGRSRSCYLMLSTISI